MVEIRTVLEVWPVLGGREVHLDVVEGLALAEVVVIGGGEEPRAVPPHDRLQEPVVDVEREHLPRIHLGSLSPAEGSRRWWRTVAGRGERDREAGSCRSGREFAPVDVVEN